MINWGRLTWAGRPFSIANGNQVTQQPYLTLLCSLVDMMLAQQPSLLKVNELQVIRLLMILVGRLFQVEYAMEAISHAGTAMGLLATDGVMLAAEKKITSKLLDQRQAQEKIFHISE